MWLHVNPRSPVPVYQQIVHAVKEAVAKGILKAGDRLPTVRELAAEYVINHNTVARAYQELERENVIQTLRSKGTFISDAESLPIIIPEKVEHLHDLIKTLLIEAHHVRMSPSELKQMFVTAVDDWTTEKEARERHERDRNV